MSGNLIRQKEFELSVADLGVNEIHAGRVDLHQYVVVADGWSLHIGQRQATVLAVAIENKGLHAATLFTRGTPNGLHQDVTPAR